MSAALRALLNQIIDYAGIFPPTKLPLDEAFQKYLQYRDETESWMLGRFICPAARLAELCQFREAFAEQWPSLVVAAIGRGGADVDELCNHVQLDLRDINEFQRSPMGYGSVDAYEVRLPNDAIPNGVHRTIAILIAEGPTTLAPFFEISLGGNWRESVSALVRGIRTAKSQGIRSPVGVKLRCGGLEASAFPSPEQIAFVITACRDAGVALKFTAGLHHPIRHFDAAPKTPVHGFLNVFVAGVLGSARGLKEDDVRQILMDTDVTSFVFNDTGLRWRDYSAQVDEIESVRRDAVLSFGSCSFDEPRDDLRGMGLLPTT